MCERIFLVSLLGSLLCLPLSAQSRIYLLSVGISRYEEPTLNLSFQTDDLRYLVSLTGKSGVFPTVSSVSVRDEQATKDRLLKLFAEYRYQIHEDDFLIFHFSGLGILDQLLPYDFNPSRPEKSALTRNELKSLLKDLNCNLILLFDIYHPEDYFRQLSNASAFNTAFDQNAFEEFTRELAADVRNGFALFQLSHDSLSFKCQGCDDSYFSMAWFHLITGKDLYDAGKVSVLSADENRDETLSIQEIGAYLQKALNSRTQKLPRPPRNWLYKSERNPQALLKIPGLHNEDQVRLLKPRFHDPETSPEVVFDYAAQMPSFPGGEAALNKFLSETLVYPAKAKEEVIQGQVFASFVVHENGLISNIEIVKDIKGLFGTEVIRAIRKMPPWIPGQQDGKPVKVKFTLPVRFKLD